jgi:hypothetical protein
LRKAAAQLDPGLHGTRFVTEHGSSGGAQRLRGRMTRS